MLLKKKVWYLRQLNAGLEPFVFRKFPVFLGRGGSCDILLDDDSVSEMHAQVNRTREGLILYDLDSEAGIHVGEHRISTLPILEAKEKRLEVRFGDVACEIVFGVPPEQTKAPPENPDAIWYYQHDGETFGPSTVESVFDAVDTGRLLRDDLVWRKGDTYRVAASEVQGLFEDSPPDDSGSETSEDESVASFSLGESGHGSVTCPCCWYKFNPDDVLFIAAHPELGFDHVVKDEPLRFLPDRFTPEGLALDAKGMKCTDMACPRCHLRIPSATLSAPVVFLSIVGAPASGKSYFLASAVWRLRTVFPGIFEHAFSDADGVVNKWVNDYEERLFFHDGPEVFNPIVKTDEDASHVYKKISIGGVDGVFLPQPCMFSINSQAAQTGPKGDRGYCLALYDNAGEHFQVGKDTIFRPGTQHLVYSEGIMFLFDPIADPRVRAYLKKRSDTVLSVSGAGLMRQDVILVEMISRIRKNLGLSSDDLYEKPLVVCLSKADLFGDAIDLPDDPWVQDDQLNYALDLQVIAGVSYKIRSLMKRLAPEVVAAVEGFARRVVYMPVSALGHNPGDDNAIDPSRIASRWVEVPLVYILGRSGFVPVRRPEPTREAAQMPYEMRGQAIRFSCEQTGMKHEVPWHYSGYELVCEKTGKKFVVPHVDAAPVV